MATINKIQAQLTGALLEDSTTVLTTPGSSQTQAVGEVFGGNPSKIGANASDTNIKLGTLSNPLMLLVWGDAGISFKIASDGDKLNAHPFASLTDIQDGLGISEIWASNSADSESTITILAVE